jgi:hypothetical protein
MDLEPCLPAHSLCSHQCTVYVHPSLHTQRYRSLSEAVRRHVDRHVPPIVVRGGGWVDAALWRIRRRGWMDVVHAGEWNRNEGVKFFLFVLPSISLPPVPLVSCVRVLSVVIVGDLFFSPRVAVLRVEGPRGNAAEKSTLCERIKSNRLLCMFYPLFLFSFFFKHLGRMKL